MARMVAVVAGLLLLLAGCGDRSPSSPAAAPEGPATVTGSFRCPDPHADPSAVVDDGSDTLPAGARAARLCLRDNHAPWTPPRGALTTGLDGLVGVVNAQEVHHPAPDEACGGVGAPAWTMVFRYDDGIRTISGDNGGCWDLLVGATERVGSRNVYEAYVAGLLRQRHGQSPPDVVWKAPDCPIRRSPADPALSYPVISPAAQPSRVVAGTWCRRDGGQWTSAGTATPAQLAVLRHDITTTGHRRHGLHLDHCRGLPQTTHTLLVGRDAWGDPLGVEFTCDVYQLFAAPYPRAGFVQLLPSTNAMIAAVHGR